MPLIHASIAPHAGDLIPETVSDLKIVTKTRDAMYEMGEHLQALKPDAIVIANPHGFRVQNAMSIAIAERATAGTTRSISSLKWIPSWPMRSPTGRKK